MIVLFVVMPLSFICIAGAAMALFPQRMLRPASTSRWPGIIVFLLGLLPFLLLYLH